MSTAFRGATLIREAVLIRGRHLFQWGYPKVRRLFEDQRLLEGQRLLEEIRYSLKMTCIAYVKRNVNLCQKKHPEMLLSHWKYSHIFIHFAFMEHRSKDTYRWCYYISEFTLNFTSINCITSTVSFLCTYLFSIAPEETKEPQKKHPEIFFSHWRYGNIFKHF